MSELVFLKWLPNFGEYLEWQSLLEKAHDSPFLQRRVYYGIAACLFAQPDKVLVGELNQWISSTAMYSARVKLESHCFLIEFMICVSFICNFSQILYRYLSTSCIIVFCLSCLRYQNAKSCLVDEIQSRTPIRGHQMATLSADSIPLSFSLSSSIYLGKISKCSLKNWHRYIIIIMLVFLSTNSNDYFGMAASNFLCGSVTVVVDVESHPNFISSPTKQMSHQATMPTKPFHFFYYLYV